MNHTPLLLIAALMACAPDPPDSGFSDTDSDTDSDSDADTDSDTDSDTGERVWQGWRGEATLSAEGWSGWEEVYAVNDDGVERCRFEWTASGTPIEACPSCDLSFAINLTNGQTIDDLDCGFLYGYEGPNETASFNYGVAVGQDDAAELWFSDGATWTLVDDDALWDGSVVSYDYLHSDPAVWPGE